MWYNATNFIVALVLAAIFNWVEPEATTVEMVMVFTAWFVVFSLWDINKKLHEE